MKMNIRTFLQQFNRRLISPSAKIEEPDERRQASLLSAFLLGLMVLAVIVEVVTVSLISWEEYTGYQQTALGVLLLAIIYGISRTEYVRAAAVLTVIVSSVTTFVTGWAHPEGVTGGLFDFLILPLWVGSLYLGYRELGYLITANLIVLLIFPQFTPEVTLDEILVGPFSFLFATSIILVIITHHRNLLEADRKMELMEREKLSRREAERSEALLRIADRLNAQLDLDTLLTAVSEEVTLALKTPVSVVALYDPTQKALQAVSGSGLSARVIKGLSPLPKEVYDQTVRQLGSSFTLNDLQVTPSQAYLDQFKSLNMRSMAFASMSYEKELIGSLTAITMGTSRSFTGEELLLLQGLAAQAALAINNTRLFKDARRRLEHLQALRAIDIAISSNHSLLATLDVLLDQITKELKVDAAVILLLNEARGQLEFGACQGFQTMSLRYTNLRLGEGMAGRAAQQRQTIHIQNLKSDPRSLVNAPALVNEGFVSYLASPLLSQGQVKGVLEIFHRSELDPDDEWLGFLETLAGQAAIAVENTSLFENLQRSNDELLKAYDATIEGWSYALDLRDKETEGHTQRVTELTMELARTFGFSERELIFIRWGALLHDIGKMGVPDRILFKEGPLTDEEWVIMRQHPVRAHDMLRTIQYLRSAVDIPYCHHEKWDGTGYPNGLKGKEIPLTARLFAVVDVWDALTSDRPYRAAWSREKTLALIREGAGQHFDPHVVEMFIELINKKKGE